jgi:hypothetical protein
MGSNSFGLDVGYHSKYLKQLIRDMDNYTPEEYARSLLRMVNVTASEIMSEPEFNQADIERGKVALEQTKLTNVDIGEGSLNLELQGGACKVFAESFAHQLKGGHGNYVEMSLHHPDIGNMTVTLQKVDGITPAGKVAAIAEHFTELKKTVPFASVSHDYILKLLDRIDKGE